MVACKILGYNVAKSVFVGIAEVDRESFAKGGFLEIRKRKTADEFALHVPNKVAYHIGVFSIIHVHIVVHVGKGDFALADLIDRRVLFDSHSAGEIRRRDRLVDGKILIEALVALDKRLCTYIHKRPET